MYLRNRWSVAGRLASAASSAGVAALVMFLGSSLSATQEPAEKGKDTPAAAESKPQPPDQPTRKANEPKEVAKPPAAQDPAAAPKDDATKPAEPAKKKGAATKKASEDPKDTRIEDIEKRLLELLQEVRSLRGAAAAPDKPQPPAEKPPVVLPAEWLRAMNWRAIGPANMGGRITDLAVYEADPCIWWVATSSGGLLKTINNGITFEHQFDKEATVSIGAVAVAQSDSNIVWVGTGENNPRNSVSYGDGVYKSTDGGKTWKNMGLKKSFQTGRIVIHPKDPNTVYVGALGRLYGPNEERGVYKTTNGGESWEKVLYIDDRTGVIDLNMHPTDPNTLIAAMWERERDGFDSWPGNDVPKADGYDGYDPIRKWGSGSGIHKTTDGGKTWKKLMAGLPKCNLGRIDVDYWRKDPNVLVAIIDCENTAKGPQPLSVYLGAVGQNADGKARLIQVIPDSPAAKAGLAVGDVITAAGDKEITEFNQVLDLLRSRRPGNKIVLKVTRGDESKELEVTLASRPGVPQVAGAERSGGVWLGATGEDREGKAHLTQVIPDSPADKAGLQSGDIVLEADSKAVGEFAQLVEQIRGRSAGDKLNLRIQRDKDTKEVEVQLEPRPGGFAGLGGPQTDVYLGIQGEDAPGGAKLVQITDDGPAQKAGLEPGDLVIKIDDKEIADYDALVDQIRVRKAGDKMALTVRRGEVTKQLTATLENRPGGPTNTRPYSFSYGGQSPNVQDQQGSEGYDYGGVYKSTDGGETWTRINSLNSRPMYFSQIRIDPSDDQFIYALGVAQHKSGNGGATFSSDLGRGVHADGHAMWIDPRDGRHMIIGCDGGTYISYDRGANWDHLNHTAIGQFYHVAIGPKYPYYVVGGLQDNGSWAGPSLGLSGGGPINEDWISVGGGDGFVCRVDPDDPDLIYYESQNGAIARRNLRTGERGSIRPTRPRGEPPYRFNWNTPFILSNHNPRIFYCAGDYVFRSLNRGDNLQAISPQITLTKRGSATALAESPRNPNVLYVGSDDGALWVTRDGGVKWTDVTKNLGVAAPRWVSTIEPSRFEEGRVYVALDGHRSNDDEPYVLASEDYGTTWRSIRGNLPWGSTRCLREDLQNPNLLVVGTEFAAWCSIDRGKHWNKMNNNLPTVAIHEFAFHPTSGEIVAATHGRSLWICDITPLRQVTTEQLEGKIALFKPTAAIRWQSEPARGRTNRRFVGQNPPSGASVYYWLPKKAERVSLKVIDVEGNVVRDIRASGEAGLHHLTWDLARVAPRLPGSRGGFGGRSGDAPPGARRAPDGVAAQRGDPPPAASGGESSATPTQDSPGRGAGRRSGGGQGEAGATPRPGTGGFGGLGATRSASAGDYRVVLTVDGQEFAQAIRVERDPNAPSTLIAEEPEFVPDDPDREQSNLRFKRIDD